jgi:hypothetical protein
VPTTQRRKKYRKKNFAPKFTKRKIPSKEERTFSLEKRDKKTLMRYYNKEKRGQGNPSMAKIPEGKMADISHHHRGKLLFMCCFENGSLCSLYFIYR